MKSKYSFIFILILLCSCKQNNFPIQKTTNNKVEEIPNNSFIDSLQYFTKSPKYFNEYYAGSKIIIANKNLMENAIKNSKYFIPQLTEKILDTTKTKITSANERINYRVGDVASELIDISRKESIENFILEEFNEKDLKNIQSNTELSIGFDELVYIQLFFNKDGSSNIENRERLYELYKRRMKSDE